RIMGRTHRPGYGGASCDFTSFGSEYSSASAGAFRLFTKSSRHEIYAMKRSDRFQKPKSFASSDLLFPRFNNVYLNSTVSTGFLRPSRFGTTPRDRPPRFAGVGGGTTFPGPV